LAVNAITIKQWKIFMKFKGTFLGLLIFPAVLILLTACGSKRLTPGEGYIQVPGGRVWYRIVGSGNATPLLVLHGGPGVPGYYLKPLAALADERPVIFYDQLGAGHSDKVTDTTLWTMQRFLEELKQVRLALGLNEIHLYGHSWGAMLATDYLLSKPAGVKSCILAGPPISIPLWSRDAANLVMALPDSVQGVIRKNEEAGTTDSPEYQAAMMQYYQLYLARKLPWSADIDSSFAQINGDLYNYMNGPSEFALTGTLRNYDRTSRLHEITVPTLFLTGQYDEAIPATVKYYQSLMPGSELIIVPGAGHLAMQDDSAFYVNALRQFLRRADGK
jgi:proline iminopeptidase